MYLQKIIVELISLTNLTCFLDRLIYNGKYDAAIFLYDDISTRDNNFIKEIASVSFGKYSMVTMDINARKVDEKVLPFLNHFNFIEIIMMDSRDWTKLIRSLEQHYFYDCTLDIIFVLEMHSDTDQPLMFKRLV